MAILFLVEIHKYCIETADLCSTLYIKRKKWAHEFIHSQLEYFSDSLYGAKLNTLLYSGWVYVAKF